MTDTLTAPSPTMWLRGRPPYGYRLITTLDGRPARWPVPDERTAPVVRHIFREYLDGKGLQTIAEQLTADGVPSPGASGGTTASDTPAWSKSAVRTILVNPRYGGFSTAVGRPRPASGEPEPIVPPEEVARVRQMFASRKAGSRSGVSALPRHLMQGLVRCARCKRVMDGTFNNAEPYYRCRIPAEYAAANKIDHPRNVYLRERVAVHLLYRWLGSMCAPRHLMRLDVPGLAQPDRLMTVEATARRLRALNQGPREQSAALQALGLRLCYSAADRTLRVKAVLEPAGLVVRGVLDIQPSREWLYREGYSDDSFPGEQDGTAGIDRRCAGHRDRLADRRSAVR
ncbi:recombinase family protein [Streptomyces sp. N2-109]|uniref:Recombinase family protein n=1 Tax=Streptomyces gossypii TaxID=2883101 RepID=A0ABT2JQ07_9ACTN|nr:recombinase family protein [Streptomyces gossypii]MCT2589609.1 recombinase family protein [Streptomyces gossypii]